MMTVMVLQCIDGEGLMTTIQGGATTEDLVEYLYTGGFSGGNGNQ